MDGYYMRQDTEPLIKAFTAPGKFNICLTSDLPRCKSRVCNPFWLILLMLM